MFYLGLIVSTCYIPGITGVSVPTQWAVLSALLPLTLWHPAPVPGLGLAVLAFATISVLWAPSQFDAAFGLWTLGFVWLLGFRLGTADFDLRELFRGLALGLSVSSIVSVFQYFNCPLPILAPYGPYPSGLLFNSALLGACATLVILGLVQFRLYAYIPLLLPSLILAQSRGAWLALIGGFAIRWVHPLAIVGLGALCALAFTSFIDVSDTERLSIWGVALRELTLRGHGIGSFNSVYYTAGDQLIHPEFVHNDYIQLWFELGVFAIPIYAALALALCQRSPVLWAFAILGTFYFPLWCPIPAFIGCVLTGRGVHEWARARSVLHQRRPNLIPRPAYPQRLFDRTRCPAIPPLPQTSYSEA
jgi:hypothetical protein